MSKSWPEDKISRVSCGMKLTSCRLSHIIWGPHDAKFHALWDELRDEHETLLLRGYTGEGFLSKGNQLGGGRVPPQSELRRLARANAEKRRVLQKGSGRRIGGTAPDQSVDIRKTIADAVERRNKSNHECASGTADAGRLADQATQQTFRTKAEEDDANNRAIAEALLDLMEEDEARKMQGTFTAPSPNGGLAWDPKRGLYSSGNANTHSSMSEEDQLRWALEESANMNPSQSVPSTKAQQVHGKRNVSNSTARPELGNSKRSKPDTTNNKVLRFHDPEILQRTSSISSNFQLGSETTPIELTNNQSSNSSGEAISWTCEICTCINPLQFLACDACGVERSHVPEKAAIAVKRKPVPLPPTKEVGWYCRECATFMEHKWWTCSGCGLMKDTS
jgi:hypothetical protein